MGKGMDDHEQGSEYNVRFRVMVDAIGLYTDGNLEQEVFGMDGFDKGMLVDGKYTENQKIAQLKNGLYCSTMELEEIGIVADAQDYVTPDGVNDDEPDMTKYPSYLDV
mmetsp:Transcript_64036/g.101933  ORF Transcript_64036/g.101933 Transcript_64036/m.101933 type:complete len:108 (+) Transcript_64036:3-326(+)